VVSFFLAFPSKSYMHSSSTPVNHLYGFLVSTIYYITKVWILQTRETPDL
jgi:hypothetical protein